MINYIQDTDWPAEPLSIYDDIEVDYKCLMFQVGEVFTLVDVDKGEEVNWAQVKEKLLDIFIDHYGTFEGQYEDLFPEHFATEEPTREFPVAQELALIEFLKAASLDPPPLTHE